MPTRSMRPVDPRRVASKIKELREVRGWSQSDLARAAGVTPAAISQIEGGGRIPTATVLALVGQVLGVSVDTILGLGPPDTEVEVFYRELRALSDNDRRVVMDVVKSMGGKKPTGG